uniref:Uncharacterized protein n=1 Tax=Arundo donax TaxID=35708 RepID=A0A0A9GPD3_ARUDO
MAPLIDPAVDLAAFGPNPGADDQGRSEDVADVGHRRPRPDVQGGPAMAPPQHERDAGEDADDERQ